MSTAMENNTTDTEDKRAKKEVFDEVSELLSAAKAGDMSLRASTEGHSAKNRRTLAVINELLDIHLAAMGAAKKEMAKEHGNEIAILHTAVEELVSAFGIMSSGDFTARFEADKAGKLDGIGKDFVLLESAFAVAMERLSSVFGAFRSQVMTMSTSSEMMLTISSQLKTGAVEMSSAAATAKTTTDDANDKIADLVRAVGKISTGSNEVSAASEEVSSNLFNVSNSVEEISTHMNGIAQSTDEMTRSMNMVAAAVEEMSASLGEVSKSSAEAAVLATEATNAAESTTSTMDKLGKSAKAIGKVVEMIKGIASQTNLLALNATIEAASAGEAGKGFAVVANEVKELAKQTAAATENIRDLVEEMQENTDQAVQAINDIGGRIGQINSISGTIAAAVEEQTATTTEMSRNLAGTADGAMEVSNNVARAAEGTNQVATNVRDAVDGVSAIAAAIGELAVEARKISERSAQVSAGTGTTGANIAALKAASDKTLEEIVEIDQAARMIKDLSMKLAAVIEEFNA